MSIARELGSTQNEAELQGSAKEVIDFEIEIAKLALNSAQTSEEDGLRSFTLNEYQANTGVIDWKRFLDLVFSSSGIVIDDDEEILVEDFEYNKNVIALLKTTIPITISNYVVWRLVMSIVPDSTAAMRNHTFKFQQALTGLTEPPPRNMECADLANAYFGLAVGVKYIKEVFHEDPKAEVESLVENIRLSFEELVGKASWMQPLTKIEAIDKAKAIRKFVGYPNWLKNKSAVEEFYKGLELGTS